jgi:hypothetical protein
LSEEKKRDRKMRIGEIKRKLEKEKDKSGIRKKERSRCRGRDNEGE